MSRTPEYESTMIHKNLTIPPSYDEFLKKENLDASKLFRDTVFLLIQQKNNGHGLSEKKQKVLFELKQIEIEEEKQKNIAQLNAEAQMELERQKQLSEKWCAYQKQYHELATSVYCEMRDAKKLPSRGSADYYSLLIFEVERRLNGTMEVKS